MECLLAVPNQLPERTFAGPLLARCGWSDNFLRDDGLLPVSISQTLISQTLSCRDRLWRFGGKKGAHNQGDPEADDERFDQERVFVAPREDGENEKYADGVGFGKQCGAPTGTSGDEG